MEYDIRNRWNSQQLQAAERSGTAMYTETAPGWAIIVRTWGPLALSLRRNRYNMIQSSHIAIITYCYTEVYAMLWTWFGTHLRYYDQMISLISTYIYIYTVYSFFLSHSSNWFWRLSKRRGPMRHWSANSCSYSPVRWDLLDSAIASVQTQALLHLELALIKPVVPASRSPFYTMKL